MKDPLQTVETPYELLKVEPGADRKAIDKAYMAALQKKAAAPAAVKRARDTLLDPVARLEHELLQYRPNVFQHLTPSPLADPSVLEAARRAGTATSWQRYLKRNCSDIWVAHALAVLWYWWTLHEEEAFIRTLSGGQESSFTSHGHGEVELHLNGQVESDLGSLHQKWRVLIGYWSMVASTPRFWTGLSDVTEGQVSVLQGKFTVRLRDQLRDLSQRYGAGADAAVNGSAGRLAEHYRSLEHALTTELATAREVGEAGILIIGGEVCFAGPLLLKEMNILDRVQGLLKEKLERHPNSKRLRELRRLLSPHRPLETLIEESKPEAALEAIRKLPDEERHSSEVARLRSRAHHMLGRQRSELGNVDEALANWKQARRYEHKKDADAQIVEDVVSTCLAESSKLEGKHLEKAIAVLEQGLKIVKEDEKLKAALSNLLTRRGFETITGVQKEVGGEPASVLARMGEIKAAFDKGIGDLDRAAGLGSKDAVRLAGEAREAIKNLEASQYYDRGVDTINKAVEKAEREKRGFTSEIKAAVKRGLGDLEKAAALGSKQAAEQAKIARRLLEQSEGGLVGTGTGTQVPGWVRKANEAGQAAEAGNWDRAIDLLRQAIKEGGREVPDNLKKNLAVCLSNRGIQRANRAVEALNRNSGGGLPDVVIEKLRKNRYSDDCAMCEKSKYSARGESWCTVSLPEGGTATLCGGCAGILQSVMEAPPGPSASTLTGMREAEKDLKEAVSLDPSNDHARQNLSDLQSVIAKVPRSASSGASPSGRSWKAPEWLGTTALFIALWLADAALGAVIAGIAGSAMHASNPETYKTFGEAFGKVFGGYMMISFLLFCNNCGPIAIALFLILAKIREWLNNITQPPRYY